MGFEPSGQGRLVVALGLLAGLAALAGLTMEAGRFRSVTLVLLGFFALRIVLQRVRSR